MIRNHPFYYFILMRLIHTNRTHGKFPEQLQFGIFINKIKSAPDYTSYRLTPYGCGCKQKDTSTTDTIWYDFPASKLSLRVILFNYCNLLY